VNDSSDKFIPLPVGENAVFYWPTPNRNLFSAPDIFFARTRANPDYGRPGWTRDCGRRFHRGCDIAPVAPRTTGLTTTVMFSDCSKNIEYASEEPVLTCDDEVFAICDGVAVEIIGDGNASPLGMHVLIEHRWPVGRRTFFTLYAHLSAIEIPAGGAVRGGHRIGRMGQTSGSADARNWMAVAPHLHFEVWNEVRDPFNPETFLRAFLPR
jgi:murein DD-endopeptidase MepM/ murein hydrolase activator NlpD